MVIIWGSVFYCSLIKLSEWDEVNPDYYACMFKR